MKEDGFNRLSGLAWPGLARAADLVSPRWGFAHEMFYEGVPVPAGGVPRPSTVKTALDDLTLMLLIKDI